MVDESGAWITIPTNSHSFTDTIRMMCNDIVEFVRHSTRAGNISNTSRAVQLRVEDVVHHATSVSNLQAARLDPTDLWK